VKKGADVNKFDKNGYNPIMNCMLPVQSKSLVKEPDVNDKNQIVNFLIQNGASVNVKNDKGITPLLTLMQCGDIDVIKECLRNGGDLTIKNKIGMNGLHYASTRLNNILEFVLSVNSSVNLDTEDNSGKTAISHAIKVGKWDNVLSLLKKGANPNSNPVNKESALMKACFSCENDVVKLMIENGVNISFKNDKKETALMYACKSENKFAVELLIENGANVNTQNRYTKTPLDISVEKKNLHIAQILVSIAARI